MDNEIRLNKRGFFSLCKDVKSVTHIREFKYIKDCCRGEGIIGSPHL